MGADRLTEGTIDDMADRTGAGMSMLAVHRRRVTPLVEDQPVPWMPDELVPDTCRSIETSIEHDRSWCLPSAGDQHGPRLSDPFWRLLDRWSRSGSSTVRSGAADVYRVLRVPPRAVEASLDRWSTTTLVVGKSSLVVSRAGPAVLRGEFAPAGTRRADVEIRFERWSPAHLCAHLRPVGRSSGRSGSTAWWSAAHDVLDELLDRLAAVPGSDLAAR